MQSFNDYITEAREATPKEFKTWCQYHNANIQSWISGLYPIESGEAGTKGKRAKMTFKKLAGRWTCSFGYKKRERTKNKNYKGINALYMFQHECSLGVTALEMVAGEPKGKKERNGDTTTYTVEYTGYSKTSQPEQKSYYVKFVSTMDYSEDEKGIATMTKKFIFVVIEK